MAMADGWQEQKVLNEVFPGRTGARTKSSYIQAKNGGDKTKCHKDNSQCHKKT